VTHRSGLVRKLLLTCALAPAVLGNPLLLAREPQEVKIQVHPESTIVPIPDDFIGFGYETSAVAHVGLLSPNDTRLIQLYRNLTPHGLVRIGGIISDHAKYLPQGTPTVSPYAGTSVINAASLQDLGGFLRRTGWKVMWGLNLDTGSKEEAAEEAMAVSDAVGDHLQSFQVGNEVDFLSKFWRNGDQRTDRKAIMNAANAGLPINKNYASYYASYLEYKAEIRAVLPHAPFSGPDAALDTTWCADFARTESADMKMLTCHYYRSRASEPDATMENLMFRDPRLETMLRKLQQICRERRIPYRINEVNSFSGGGKSGVSDTFGSALWCLDFMFLLASHECGGLNIETDVNQMAWVSHYSPIFRDESGHLIARPCYYGMLAFALAARGDLLGLTIAQADINLTAYSTRDGQGHIWVTIINKDLHRSAQVTVSLPGSSVKGDVFRLRAPSVESKDDVTLAGAAVADDGTWTARSSETIARENEGFDIDVPKASAALLRVD
jgi:hypothetical protein